MNLRSSTRGKTQLTYELLNTSANTSYVTIVSEEQADSNTDTLENINMLLRDKLAMREGELETSESEIGRLHVELDGMRMDLEVRDRLIAELRDTVQLLSRGKSVTLRDNEAQTVDLGPLVGGDCCCVGVPAPVGAAALGAGVSGAGAPAACGGAVDCCVGAPVEAVGRAGVAGGRVLVLGDSHGRGSGAILRDCLGSGFSVFTLCKPNAGLEEMLRDVDSFCADFGDRDYIIVMGGVNDLLRRRALSDAVFAKLKLLSTMCNLVCLSVPYWDGKNDLNRSIYSFNYKLYNLVNVLDGNSCFFVDSNIILDSSDKTNHGLHMNYKGKMKLFRYVSALVLNIHSAKMSYCSNLITIPCTDFNDCNPEGDSMNSSINFMMRGSVHPQI